MSPGEMAESFGWGPLVSVALAIGMSLLGYGASNQRNKQTEKSLDELGRDHSQAIKEVRAAAEKAATDLSEYKLFARDRFVITDDLKKVEQSLSAQIATSTSETSKKVEELRQEFGRKGIEHTIKNAIASGLAQAHFEAKQRSAS